MSLKKTLTSLICTSSLLFGCATQKTNYQKFIKEENSQKWEHLQFNMPDNLEKVESYMIGNLYSIDDLILLDRWNSPKTTILRGGGDCDDMAILGAYLAEPLGYPPKTLFMIHFFFKGHFVTLLEDNNNGKIKYGAIDNGEVFYPVYNSIDNLIHDIERKYNKKVYFYKIIELNSLNKNWRTTEKNLSSLFEKIFGFFDFIPVKH